MHDVSGSRRPAVPGERPTAEGAVFQAPRWLAPAHLQSILPSLRARGYFVRRRASRLLAVSHDVILDCGEGVRLLGHHSAQPAGADDLVVLIHGWEGSARSQYLLSVSQYLYDRGFDIFRLNLRDHGPTHHLNEGLFHSCRIAEVVGAVAAVQRQNPGRRLSIVGYSLGGNFALRVAARAAQAGLMLHRVIAICPVLDPAHTLVSLETGLPIYRHYFIHKWRSSLLAKQRAFPGRYDFREMLHERTLTRLTADLVAEYTDFPDLASYFAGYAVVGEALANLTVSTRIIAAADDPIISAADLPRLARPPSLTITRMERGGHCGFLDSVAGPSWADREIHATLTANICA